MFYFAASNRLYYAKLYLFIFVLWPTRKNARKISDNCFKNLYSFQKLHFCFWKMSWLLNVLFLTFSFYFLLKHKSSVTRNWILSFIQSPKVSTPVLPRPNLLIAQSLSTLKMETFAKEKRELNMLSLHNAPKKGSHNKEFNCGSLFGIWFNLIYKQTKY